MTVTYFILKHCRYALSFLTRNNPRHDLIVQKFKYAEEYIRQYGFIRLFKNYASALIANNMHSKYEADVGITVIIKNEAPYIREWIEFHKLVGVGKFFIYDNDSTDNVKEILKPYIEAKDVVYTYLPGKKQQMPAYQMSIKQNRHKVKYMAIIDADEFILPLKHKTIIEFIDYLENKIGSKIDAVGINWLIHGFNGHYTKQEGLVCENYKKCDRNAKECDIQIKTILNPRSVIGINHPHYAIYLPGSKIVSTSGDEMTGFCTEPNYDDILIHHYWTKSFEEYQERINKGKADGNKPVKLTYTPEYLSVDEDNSMDEYIKILKEKLKV